jgi:hypothetical protein
MRDIPTAGREDHIYPPPASTNGLAINEPGASPISCLVRWRRVDSFAESPDASSEAALGATIVSYRCARHAKRPQPPCDKSRRLLATG